MKQIICSRITTLSPSEQAQVVGGKTKTSDVSDKVNGAVCKAFGGGKSCGGCGSGASNRNGNGYDKYKQDNTKHNYNQYSSASGNTGSSKDRHAEHKYGATGR